MKNQITLSLNLSHSIQEFQKMENGCYVRDIGKPYFQLMPEGKYLLRVVTNDTDGKWLESMINKKLIFKTDEGIRAEVV